MINVKHTHGTTESFNSVDDALAALSDVYGSTVVVYSADGGSFSSEDDLRSGRALVWQDEKSSVDDDGARAVASIYVSL
jgi:hypothetical protein